MSEQVKIFEVGPRDGLQNESNIIPTIQKVKLVNLLSECGFSNIETSSFVSPKWVPQLADAHEVFVNINRKANIRYCALTPNLKGYERAIEAGANEVAIFSAASETFSQKNTNCSIAEGISRFCEILAQAMKDNIKVRGYISCVVECPYEGITNPAIVSELTQELLAGGCYEISLGDTIGKGTPATVTKMLDKVLQVTASDKLAGHFHDTGGNAMENILASARLGLRTFDSAVGGLGGCPYAPGAKGNVSTRDAVQTMENAGYTTGIDLEKLTKAESYLLEILKDPD